MASKVDEFLPEFDPLTPIQEAQVITFALKYLSDDVLPPSYDWLKEGSFAPAIGGDMSATEGNQREKLQLQANRRHIIAYKLLTARKWDTEKAAEMLKSSTEWRERNSYHTRPFFPSPIVINGYDNDLLRDAFKMGIERPTNEDLDRIVHRLRPHYACNFHKWDKAGHPVIIELIGRVDARGALKSLKELVRPGQPLSQPVAEMHSFQNELANYLIRFQDAQSQQKWVDLHGGKTLIPSEGPLRRITSMTAILDASGLHMGLLSSDAIEIINTTLSLDQANYPELLHRCFIVNCPSLVMFAYNIFKGSIDPRVRSKITFCSVEDTPAILRKVIDPEHLPKFLGGECVCTGGCVCQTARADGTDGGGDEPCDEHFVRTEEVSIGAGKRETREMILKKGAKVAWEWDAPDGSTVEFSVAFVPDDVPTYLHAVESEKTRLLSGGTSGPSSTAPPAEALSAGENAIAISDLDRWSVLSNSTEKKGPTAGRQFVSVAAPTKVLSAVGTFNAHEMGKLVIVWSNEFSWMRGKVVRFRVINEDPVPLQ